MVEDTPLWLVEDAETLQEVAERLSSASVIGVDTESDSFYHYQEKVCLIQFSDLEADCIVDPLAIDDLSPLGPVFADRGIVKVLHGADYDVVCLGRDYGFRIHNIFDTMIAAQMIGSSHVGLADLIADLFGQEIDKQYQRHDWAARPLREEHLEYARGDTHWLIAVREILLRRLRRKGRIQHVQEECRLLEDRRWTPRPFDPDGYLKVKGASTLDDTGKRILKRFYLYRDSQAREMDRPVFKVIPDSVLVSVAEARPVDLQQLSERLPGKMALKRRHGAALVQAVVQGLEDDYPIPKKKKKKKAKRPSEPKARLKGRAAERVQTALRSWRNRVVQREPDRTPLTVASNSVLKSIARYRPTTLEELEAVPEVRRWQVHDFGEQILDVLDRVDPGRHPS